MWYNALLSMLLRSPFHGMLSKSILLITVTGRKSGRTYSIPVNYLRQRDTLWVTSRRDRTWWRNLKGGAPVQVLLAGRSLEAHGEAITDESAVAKSLAAYFQLAPQIARYFGVALTPDGSPSPFDLSRAAQTRIVVRIDLFQPPAAMPS